MFDFDLLKRLGVAFAIGCGIAAALTTLQAIGLLAPRP